MELVQLLGWPVSVFNGIGVVGSLLVIAVYCLVTFEKISTQSYLYFTINIIAAILLGLSLLVKFNAGSMLIEVFWFSVSIIGIIRLYMKRRSK